MKRMAARFPAALAAAGLHFLRAGEPGVFAAGLMPPFIIPRRRSGPVVLVTLWSARRCGCGVTGHRAGAHPYGAPWARFALSWHRVHPDGPAALLVGRVRFETW